MSPLTTVYLDPEDFLAAVLEEVDFFFAEVLEAVDFFVVEEDELEGVTFFVALKA